MLYFCIGFYMLVCCMFIGFAALQGFDRSCCCGSFIGSVRCLKSCGFIWAISLPGFGIWVSIYGWQEKPSKPNKETPSRRKPANSWLEDGCLRIVGSL